MGAFFKLCEMLLHRYERFSATCSNVRHSELMPVFRDKLRASHRLGSDIGSLSEP